MLIFALNYTLNTDSVNVVLSLFASPEKVTISLYLNFHSVATLHCKCRCHVLKMTKNVWHKKSGLSGSSLSVLNTFFLYTAHEFNRLESTRGLPFKKKKFNKNVKTSCKNKKTSFEIHNLTLIHFSFSSVQQYASVIEKLKFLYPKCLQ